MLFLVGRKTKARIEKAANSVTGHICLLIDLQEKRNGEVREGNNVKPWKLEGGWGEGVLLFGLWLLLVCAYPRIPPVYTCARLVCNMIGTLYSRRH